jgi:Zn-dependent peptidase ImmA (M78 family)
MEPEVKLTRSHINKILDWCINTYGKSNFNKQIPVVEFKKPDYSNEDCMAFYDEIEGLIFINKEQNTTLYDLANSIIHEYTHYKQNMKHYQILSLYLPDHKNPMEIEAEKVAKKDTKKCLKEVFNIQSIK